MIGKIVQMSILSLPLFLCADLARADFYWHEPDSTLCEVKKGADPLNAKEADFNMVETMQLLEGHDLYRDDEDVPYTIIELTLMRMHALAIKGELRKAQENNDVRKTRIYQQYYDTYKNKFCNAIDGIMWPS